MEGVFQHDQFTLHALFIEHPIHQVRIRSQRLVGITAHLDRRELLQLIEIGTGDLRISSVGLRRKHLHKRIKSFRLDRIVDDIVDLLEQTSRFSLSDRHKALFYINDTLCFFRDHNGICYQIVDDGAGMDDTTLNSLLSPSKAKGFGISNVNQRIKLAFSEKYGVQINSTKDRGTTVIATIPKIKKEAFDGNNH